MLRTTDGRRAPAVVTDLPLVAPITNGMVHVLDGRPPTGPDEVLLTPGLADEFGVGVGDALDLDRPERMTVTVSGLGVDTDQARDPLLVLGPGRPVGIVTATPPLILVDLPDDAGEGQHQAWAHDLGLVLPPASGDEAVPPGRRHRAAGEVVGNVVLTAAGIVIAAAFAAGTRRQLTTIGLLSANGAPPALVRRVLLLEGAIAGALGTLAGLTLAAAILVVGRLRGRSAVPEPSRAMRWQWGDLAVIGAVGIAVSAVAAAVPARALSRVPVVTALAGRRPVGAVPRGVTLAALGLFAGGVLAIRVAVPGPFEETPLAGPVVLVSVGVQAVLIGMAMVTPGARRLRRPPGAAGWRDPPAGSGDRGAWRRGASPASAPTPRPWWRRCAPRRR